MCVCVVEEGDAQLSGPKWVLNVVYCLMGISECPDVGAIEAFK